MIRFACPGCNKVYSAGDELAGRKTSCKQCGAIVVVPQAPIREVLYGVALPPEGVVEATPEPDAAQPQSIAPQSIAPQSVTPPSVAPQASWQQQTQPEPRRADPPPRRRRQYEHDDEDDYIPLRRRRKKHSGLGIGSFIIAMVVGGLDAILGLIVVLNVSGSKGDWEVKERIVGGAMGMVCFNCLSIPLCLVGVGLAVAALIAQADRKHSMTYVGLLVNALVILAVLGLYTFGSVSRR
jgi:hypothetical protein